MKKQILLLQFRLPPTDTHEIECICNAMGIKREDLIVRNIALNKELTVNKSEYLNFKGVIWGASSDFNVTDWSETLKESVERLKPFLLNCIDKNIPTLGICFGHQVMAYLLGARVVRDNDQSEGGIIDMTISKQAKDDPLFLEIPQCFSIATGHKDSVVSLPPSMSILATSERTKIEAYKVGKSTYGVQTHPELSAEALAWRMSLFPEYTMGRSLEEIKNSFRPMPHATKILKNFKKIVDQGII